VQRSLPTKMAGWRSFSSSAPKRPASRPLSAFRDEPTRLPRGTIWGAGTSWENRARRSTSKASASDRVRPSSSCRGAAEADIGVAASMAARRRDRLLSRSRPRLCRLLTVPSAGGALGSGPRRPLDEKMAQAGGGSNGGGTEGGRRRVQGDGATRATRARIKAVRTLYGADRSAAVQDQDSEAASGCREAAAS